MPAVSQTTKPRWQATIADYPRVCAWSPDVSLLAIGSGAGEISLLDVADGSEIRRWSAHEGGVIGLTWHPKEPVLVSTGDDGAVRIWSITGDLEQTPEEPAGTFGSLAVWHPTGMRLATAVGRQVKVYGRDGTLVSTPPPVESTVAGLQWAPNGKRLLAACYGGVRVFDPSTGRKDIVMEWKGSMIGLAISPDGKVVACGCQDNSMHFWRLPSARDSMMSGYPLKPKAISWSADSLLLASSGSNEATIWQFDGRGPEGREPLVVNGHYRPLTALSFAPTLNLLATGCRDGNINLWLPSQDDDPMHSFNMEARIESLEWGFDTQAKVLMLASTAIDGTVSLWPMR